MAIELIDKIVPKNNGDFALMDAVDVSMDNAEGQRLSSILRQVFGSLNYVKAIILTREEYFEIASSGQVEQDVLYVLYSPTDGMSGSGSP